MQEQIAHNHQPHGWRAALRSLVLFAALASAILLPRHSQAATGEALINGSFEGGFVNQPHCRWRNDLYETTVGAGWSCFTNQGVAHYGFYDDAWTPVLVNGQHSQLIEINTWGLQRGDNDRYAGIYQTVPTQMGAQYQLSLRGMIRTTNLEGDPWRYRVQVGYLRGADGDWSKVQNWTDVGWDIYYPRTEPGAYSEYQTTLIPSSPQITLFIRVWKKWGLPNEELNVNLDSIAFVNMGMPLYSANLTLPGHGFAAYQSPR